MIDGGVSYILVHQTGLADTAVAENNNLLAVRSSRDTEFLVSLKHTFRSFLREDMLWDGSPGARGVC